MGEAKRLLSTEGLAEAEKLGKADLGWPQIWGLGVEGLRFRG